MYRLLASLQTTYARSKTVAMNNSMTGIIEDTHKRVYWVLCEYKNRNTGFALPHTILQKMALTSHFLLENKMPRSIEHAIAAQDADAKTTKSTAGRVRVHIIAE